MLRALEANSVRYLVVGGVAVVLHGVLRTTLDLDLVLHLDEGNLSRAIDSFDTLGFQPRVPVPLAQFAQKSNRESWIEEKNMIVFSLWHPERHGFTIDLFLREPFDFAEAFERRLQVRIDDIDVPILSRDDLIAMKRAAGRVLDLDDAERLQHLPREDHDDSLR